MKKFHIRKGDTVFVNAGNDKGKTGKVLEVSPSEGKVIVEGRNIVVTTSANAAVKVYNVAGMQVRSIEPADGVAVAVGMEPGIYVVSTAHSTHKVIVR